jgi:hypothetical protein
MYAVGTVKEYGFSAGPGLMRNTLRSVEFAVQKSRCKWVILLTF